MDLMRPCVCVGLLEEGNGSGLLTEEKAGRVLSCSLRFLGGEVDMEDESEEEEFEAITPSNLNSFSHLSNFFFFSRNYYCTEPHLSFFLDD